MGPGNVTKGKGSGGAFGFAFVALLCAAAAALVAVQMTRGYKIEKKRAVVVAKRNISAAETITADMVEVRRWPADQVPDGAVASLKELFGDAKDRKPIASTGILTHEPIVKARLADPSKGTALATLLRPGFRAVAVKIDNNVARAGLIYPGAQVDVVGTIRDPGTHDAFTRILTVNVRVLAVEAHTDVETFRPKEQAAKSANRTSSQSRDAVVTVELTPDQAELVFLAQRDGHVDLALRNAADDGAVVTPGASPGTVITAKQWEAPEAEPPPVPGAMPTPVVEPAPAAAATERTRSRVAGRRRRGPQVHKTQAEIIASDRPAAPAPAIETYNAQKR